MNQKSISEKETKLRELTGKKLTTVSAGYIDFKSKGDNHGKYIGNKWWGLSWRSNNYTTSNRGFVLQREENSYERALEAALEWVGENPEKVMKMIAANVSGKLS